MQMSRSLLLEGATKEIELEGAIKEIENIEDINEALSWFQKQIPDLLEFGKKLIIVLILIFIGRKLIRLAEKILNKSFQKSKMDEGIAKFLLSLIGVALNIFILLISMKILGLESSSLVALVGSAGLAIGLALQGSLANFAGGVLILIMKPFRIGDYIITKENEGTVSSIDIFYTKLLTADNRLVVIPNGILSNSSITNVTNEPIRRLDLNVSIDYSENIIKAKNILEELGNNHALALKERPTEVFVFSFDPSAIKMGIRVWVARDNYWSLKCDLLMAIKMAFDENEIVIPFDQIDVNINNK